MRTDLLPARAVSAGPPVLAAVAATLAVALDGPAWLTTVLSAVAFVLTAERLVRRRQLGWADAVLSAVAGLIIVLMLLGFLLDVLPGGLGRVSWALGAGVLALIAIAWSEREGGGGTEPLTVDRARAVRLAPAYAVAAGLAAVALIVSVHATREATRAPAALSIVHTGRSGQVSVEISAGQASGRYELVATRGGRQLLVDGPFTLAADEHVRRTIMLPRTGRSMVSVRVAGSSTTLRSLTVSPAGTP